MPGVRVSCLASLWNPKLPCEESWASPLEDGTPCRPRGGSPAEPHRPTPPGELCLENLPADAENHEKQ